MEIAEFKINLGRFRIPLIKGGLKILDKWLIAKIPFGPLKLSVQKNYDLLEDVADKLTDKDPNNLEQLKAVWEKHKEDTVDDLKMVTREGIQALVKDPFKAAIMLEIFDEMLAEQEDEAALLARVSVQ